MSLNIVGYVEEAMMRYPNCASKDIAPGLAISFKLRVRSLRKARYLPPVACVHV